MSDGDGRDVAASLVELNGARNSLFGEELFSNPAWDVLVALFSAERPMTAAQLADQIGCGATVIRRWLAILADRTLVTLQVSAAGAGYRLDQAAASGMESMFFRFAATIREVRPECVDRVASKDAIADAN